MTAEPQRAMMRFLLGEMPAEERAEFEDKYIKDTDLFHRVVELENDLIDRYAMGALTEPERKRLEQSFLADPERRKRLAFARAAGQLAGEEPTVCSPPGIRPRWFHPSSAALVSIAFLLPVMLAGISWLLVANHQLNAELEALRSRQAAAQQTEAALQQRVDNLTQELKARNQPSEQTAPVETAGQTLMAFTLKSDALRSDTLIPRLVVPATTSSIALHLVFPADPFSSYELFVENANGTPVWHKDRAKSALAAAGSKEIVARLPARLLKTGDYIVRIIAQSSHGTEDVAGYSFSVVHR